MMLELIIFRVGMVQMPDLCRFTTMIRFTGDANHSKTCILEIVYLSVIYIQSGKENQWQSWLALFGLFSDHIRGLDFSMGMG